MEYGFESESAKEFPSIVQLTITNVCDMSCCHCPHSDYKKQPGYKPSFMDMGLYRKVVDEMGQYDNTTLRIFGWGEPLLHPKLVEMIAYATQQGVTTNLITNGLNMDEKKIISLIEGGLDLLEVSLDALTRETYAKVRGNAKNFDRIFDNLHAFRFHRDRLNRTTYITASIINQPKAQHEVEGFTEYWSNHIDDVVLRQFHDFMGNAHDRDKIELPERHPCRCLWSRFNVNSEGLVSVCFNDWYNETILGDMNVPGTKISGIWKNSGYENMRQNDLNGTPKGVCKNCNDWIGASWEIPYEKLVAKAKSRFEK